MPSPAGDTADILSRVIASKLRELYPANVVAENRTGVGGNIVVVFRAEPNGRTLLASPPARIAINQYLYKMPDLDPARWVPVTVLATVPNVLVVNPRLPVRNVAEFITCLKANPGEASFASQGNGTTSHLTGTERWRTCLTGAPRPR